MYIKYFFSQLIITNNNKKELHGYQQLDLVVPKFEFSTK